jgi:membrane protein YdbS with pleckstrin-like domain
MKINRDAQIPNVLVYVILYAVVFGISFWVLLFHPESSTNWIMYVAMTVAILGAVIKLALHWRKSRVDK